MVNGAILACVIPALLVGLTALAQTTDQQSGQAAAGASPSPIIEQRALDLLKSMSNTLASAGQFTYRSHSAVEAKARTGQIVTLFSTSEVALKRPDKLSVKVTGEPPNFDFYYDGKTVTAFSPAGSVYSTIDAPATIDAMLPFLQEKTDVYFPSADVMYSDPYTMMTRGLTSAFVVGTDTVDGVACEHLAFMGQGINWEIWIDTGPKPLPRRLAVTYTDVKDLPRFLVRFSDWNLRPELDDASFVFQKPGGAKETQFEARMKTKEQSGNEQGR
jgi:hypothetical protein